VCVEYLVMTWYVLTVRDLHGLVINYVNRDALNVNLNGELGS